jgi:hypothetical protein
MKNKGLPFLYGVAIVLIFLLHVVLLDKIPRGLNVDEIGSAYDAWSLGHFGVDRWMKSWPLYLKNYGDGQNILYTYLLVPFLLFFPANYFTVRSVIVLSAIVMAIFGAGIIKLLYDDKKAQVAFLFLYAAMPAFTIMLRFGLESHLEMSVSIIALYYLIKAVKTRRISAFLLTGIFSGLVLYTYALSYISVPLFLFIALIYLIIKRNINFKEFMATAVPFVLLSLPLALVQIINLFDLPELVIGPFTFTKLRGYRSGELMLTGFFKKLWLAFKVTLFHDDLYYNSVPLFGNFYYISVPFILLGCGYSIYATVKSLKKEEKISLYAFPLFWGFASFVIAGFMSTASGYINLTRMNGNLSAVILFLFEGIYLVFTRIKKENLRKIFVYAVIEIYAFCLIIFTGFYFIKFDEKAYPYKWLFYEPYDEEIFSYLDDPENGLQDVNVHTPWNYMYYIWSAKVNPFEANMIQPEEGDRDIKEIGRFKMNTDVNLNEVFIYYKYGFTSETHNYFQNVLHEDFYETDNFITYLSPFRSSTFFGKDVMLGDTEYGSLNLERAYMGAVDGEMAPFYGWISVPEDVPEVHVSVKILEGIIDCPVISDETEDERIICFMGSIPYESFYESDVRDFIVEGFDEDGNLRYSVTRNMFE